MLVEPLTAVQKEYPQVQVGSYPDDSTSNAYRVRVALEARDRKLVEEVSTHFLLVCYKVHVNS